MVVRRPNGKILICTTSCTTSSAGWSALAAGTGGTVPPSGVTFNGVCTGCHGRDGAAGDRAPALGDPARKYLRNSDDEIFDAMRKGMPGTEMPPR